jgi:hypothetical protein
VQDYEELDEDLNNLSDDDVEPHLTKQDYEKYLDLGSLFDDDQDVNNLGDSTYKGLVDSIMVELQNKYNLRPREKSSTNNPPRKILSRNKANEPVISKAPIETQVARS